MDAEGTNDDIAIVDWLEDTRGPVGWWLYSFCALELDVDGIGGGSPPTTRCAVLSIKFRSFPTNLPGDKFVENPPLKK